MTTDRRTFVKHGGLGLLVCRAGGVAALISPAQARSESLAFRVLGDAETKTLEAICEVLLPGSAESGVAHFVDYQLSNPLREIKLMVRYLSGISPPYELFYQQGLAAVQKSAREAFGRPFEALQPDDKHTLIQKMMGDQMESWDGPPPRQFYLALKSDSVDVMYGTREGIESLGVPYMPHLIPPNEW